MIAVNLEDRLSFLRTEGIVLEEFSRIQFAGQMPSRAVRPDQRAPPSRRRHHIARPFNGERGRRRRRPRRSAASPENGRNARPPLIWAATESMTRRTGWRAPPACRLTRGRSQ